MRIRESLRAAVLLSALCLSDLAVAQNTASKPRGSVKTTRNNIPTESEQRSVTLSSYRGWDYLVSRLRDNSVPESELRAIYADPRMPRFTFVPFNPKPREPASIYSSFDNPRFHEMGFLFIERHEAEFDRVEKTLRVPREIVAAILVVESGIGQNTGQQMIAYRLSRLASCNEPGNIRQNYHLQKKKDPTVSLEQIKRRGRYLEHTFLPEIPALLEISKRNKVDVLTMRGSMAGAFGMPQFLPSAFLRFGMDGDKNGIISLHNERDALWSTANYLGSYGYRKGIPLQEKRAIIWRYNKSKSYIDTILRMSQGIEKLRND